MTIDELYDLVIQETAMFIPDSLELDKNQFLNIVKRDVLPQIGKWKPASRVTWINMATSPWIFVEDAPYMYIPDWISDVAIAMSNQAVSMASVIPSMFRQDHRTRLWYYDKPKLYTFLFGLLQVECCYAPRIVQTTVDGATTYDILYLEDAASLSTIKLTSGYWMRAIGMSRRQANFTDMGITFDSEQLVLEGQRLIDEELGSMQVQDFWWKAVS